MAMIVGTISFARNGDAFHIGPKERVRLILAAAAAYEPNILLTAGHAVHSRKHLHRLAKGVAFEAVGTTIVTEVHDDGDGDAKRLSNHALYVTRPNGSWSRLGRQMFAKREETIGAQRWRVELFKDRLHRRLIEIAGRRVFALCCGELNAVIGREYPRFIDPLIGETISMADIILNPTHDRMGRAGMLDAKRRFLSEAPAGGSVRAYFSCSNWNLSPDSGIPQYPSATIHTAYVAGQRIQPHIEAGGEEWSFLYRAYHVP